MEESGIDQLNKLDSIFNTTAKKFRRQIEKQHPQPGQNTPTPEPKLWEKNSRL